jgi:hypothetical protein
MTIFPRKKFMAALCAFCWTAVALGAQDAGEGRESEAPQGPPYRGEESSGRTAGHERRPPPPSPNRVPPGFKNRALSFNIIARVFEKTDGGEWAEVWQADSDKNTISGQPVSIKLAGTNIIVIVQITPYLRGSGQNMLVAQGQIWLEDEMHNVHYQTTISSIPVDFGEEIFYFPLGERNENSVNFIEICITMNPYTDE